MSPKDLACIATGDNTLLSRNASSASSNIIDADFVLHRLEEAGRTLLALPNTGPSTRLVQSGMEWVRDVREQYGRDRVQIRPAIPDAAQITRMDQALAWIPLIADDKYVLRRVVGARCLVSPMTGRHLYSWRRLGEAVGADHKAVQRWHAQGIDLIVKRLRAAQQSPKAVSAIPTRLRRLRTGSRLQPAATGLS